MCSRETCKKLGVFSLNRSLKEKSIVFFCLVFSSPSYAASYFSMTNQGEKTRGELKRRLGEGKGIFLSKIHDDKTNATKFCRLSPLIKRLFIIGIDVCNDGRCLAAS